MLQQDIEVPETLLKKRKQNEKAREERLEKAASAKKVRVVFVPPLVMYTYPGLASKTCFTMLPPINHLSGLMRLPSYITLWCDANLIATFRLPKLNERLSSSVPSLM